MSDLVKRLLHLLESQDLDYPDEIAAAAAEIERLRDELSVCCELKREYQERLDAAVAAERDCRTCRNFSTHSGGCVSVLRCTNANAYQRAGFRQYWETTPKDAGF